MVEVIGQVVEVIAGMGILEGGNIHHGDMEKVVEIMNARTGLGAVKENYTGNEMVEMINLLQGERKLIVTKKTKLARIGRLKKY